MAEFPAMTPIIDKVTDYLLLFVTDWATLNNLSLNLSKSEEIVFIDKRRKSEIPLPNS